MEHDDKHRDVSPAGARSAKRLWSAAPWVLLVVGVVATAVLAAARHQSVQSAQDEALATAEGHFRDVVSDLERRLALEQDRLDGLALSIGAHLTDRAAPDADLLDDFVGAAETERRLPDVRAVLVVSEDGDGRLAVVDSARLDSEGHTSLPASPLEPEVATAFVEGARTGKSALARAVRVAGLGGDNTVIAYPPVSGSQSRPFQVALVFADHRFLAGALSGGHHVTSSLLGPDGAHAIVGSAADDVHHTEPADDHDTEADDTHHTEPADEHDSTADDTRHTEPAGEGQEAGRGDDAAHPHGNVDHIHDPAAGFFSATRPVEVAGEIWQLEVNSSGGFANVPESRETLIVVFTGLIMTAAVFLLLRRLTAALLSRSEVALSLAESNDRFLTGFESAPIGMAEIAMDGTIQRINPTMCAQLGTNADALVGTLLGDVVHPEDRPLHEHTVAGLGAGERAAAQVEIRYVGEAGNPIWVVESMSLVPSRSSAPPYVLVHAQDVTARRAAESMLARRALHDELTGLPNRALLFDRMRQLLSRSRRSGSQLAVLFVDLDRFKVVNDSLGHTAGDELLTTFAQRLVADIREHDTIARFGGDEFVMVCEVDNGPAEVGALADRISRSLAEPIVAGGAELQVTASIGISVGGGVGSDDTAETLLRDADAAMYRAKDKGRNQTATFDAEMRAAAVERLDLEQELRHGMACNELELYYQPLIRASERNLAGVEALIRWRHPVRGLLAPDAFLTVAGEVGLITKIDEFALSEACRQLGEWDRAHESARSLIMAVNCSAASFLSPGFCDLVASAVSRNEVEAHRLWIEVTEGALLDDTAAALATMDGLRRIGVRIAIDDFGTGYSSLSYLTQFRFDVLKLDRSFLRPGQHDSPHAAVLAAVSDMARAVGTPVVVEGIEHAHQLGLVASLKADFVQGYFFDKPRPPSEIEQRYLAVDPAFVGTG